MHNANMNEFSAITWGRNVTCIHLYLKMFYTKHFFRKVDPKKTPR